ncbi:MAG TPA: tetratricopeptide repeat protein, partial [Pirellulales bacterium]|nr:tetratricopeptide repeat protein [Pirellulales bacterium]
AQGNNDLAEQFAQRAFQLSAGPNANADDLKPRFEIAGWLEANGMRPWCEREFRYIISHGKQDSDEVVESRLMLSEILHDEEREQEAAEVLLGLVDAVAMSSDLDARLTSQLRHPPKSIRSRMYYFYACQYEATNDRPHQIEQLRLAIASDPKDADVLIALYHLPGQDAQARKQTLDLIRAAAAQFRVELNDDPDQYSVYNEVAWLIANTEGDLDQALEYAHKAVELRPDEGGLLDTLAHCYAAKKDFENAVKYQSRAAELDPNSLQIRHALGDYRKSLDATKRRK